MSLLNVIGEVDAPQSFERDDLASLPDQVPDVGAVVAGRQGSGVRLSAILRRVGARADFLTLCSSDGFSISVPRAAVEDGIVTYRLGAAELPPQHGGPVRFHLAHPAACDTGGVDACANVKRLSEIRLTAQPAPDTHRH